MGGPRVVVIGAGVVGAALADELSARGWNRLTVLDQGPLPAAGGSSSHAPGLVFQTNPSRTMARLAQYTVEKLVALGCFTPVGGLEVATTPQRLAELHRRCGWATAWGLPDAQVLPPAECAARHPLLDPDAILGGLHLPTDGVADALAAVEAQLGRARSRGVCVREWQEVRDIRTAGGRVTGVVTDQGELPADIVVCCAGIWGPRVAGMVGVPLPLTPLAHQLVWTAPVPALAANAAGRPGAREAVRPILRHQDADLYVRERFDRLGVGSYGHRPMPVSPQDIAPAGTQPMPSVLPFTEADFAPAWAATRSLLPATRESTVETGINGLFSFTTDNMPLLGPSAQVRGFWVAEAVWVTHSAGVGRAVAEWLVDGYPTLADLRECDVNRFEPHQLAPEYVLARTCRNYVEVYDIIHPLQSPAEPRPVRTSPFYLRQRELGGYFLEAGGWECPRWYETNAALLSDRHVPAPGGWAARYWSPVVGAEALATREGVALYDLTPGTRLEVSGRGATAFLRWITTGDVDRPAGSVIPCLLLERDGGVRADVTVTRLGAEQYRVAASGNADLAWLSGHAPDGVSVRDLTDGTCCVGVWGPKAPDLVAPLCGAELCDAAVPPVTAVGTRVGPVPVTALPVSTVGEPGWELHASADLGVALWDALWRAGAGLGLTAAGQGALDSLRLEEGVRRYGTDVTGEHDPYEAGLGWAVAEDKGEFLGRDAVLRRRERVRRRLVRLRVDRAADVPMGREPVYEGQRCVGYVTSAAYGYTLGTGIAYAWLPARLAEPGETVHIGYFDRRIPASVVGEPRSDRRPGQVPG